VSEPTAADPSELTEARMPEFHRREAVAANQRTWELLAREDRTTDDDLELLDAAHASAYHWHAVGSALHWQRADWLLARVYCALGWGEPAMAFARRCMLVTEKEGFEGFDRAYAFEALARASAAAGDTAKAAGYREQAMLLGAQIEDPEDREIFESDLATEPWFGLST
jgi:hypothetical protein